VQTVCEFGTNTKQGAKVVQNKAPMKLELHIYILLVGVKDLSCGGEVQEKHFNN
jgi:hypothetical protein